MSAYADNLALARKAGERLGEDAYNRGFAEGFLQGSDRGFAAGMAYAESHCFALPDTYPDAEHLRGRMLDLDPYEPIQREDTP